MSIGPGDVLAIWERSSGLHPIDAAVEALSVVRPDRDLDELARLPLGQRDAALLECRRQILGDILELELGCPACGSRFEADISCVTLLSAAREAPAEWQIEVDRYRLRLRPIDSRDVALAVAASDEAGARLRLLDRVVVDARRGGRPIPVKELPAAVTGSIAASLSQHDPLSEVLLDTRCPGCGVTNGQIVDVARVVIEELAIHGLQLLGEVDLLARTYGWTQAEILGLSAVRRGSYVSLAGG